MHVAGAACHCGLLVCLNILVVVIDKGVWNAFPVFQSVTDSLLMLFSGQELCSLVIPNVISSLVIPFFILICNNFRGSSGTW